MRRTSVPEYLVDAVMSLYKGCKTAFSVDQELSSSFSVKVGFHQGSTLSLLFFIMVMDALKEDMRDGLLMELLYAEDLVFCGESFNEVMVKYERWKNAVKGTGLRVNVDKTKGMQLSFRKKNSVSKVSVMNGLVVILFSARNVRGRLIVVILMCLGRWVYYRVGMSLSAEHVLLIIVQ